VRASAPATLQNAPPAAIFGGSDAGWSSLAARRAHNPKVAGSNPAPATRFDGRQVRFEHARRVLKDEGRRVQDQKPANYGMGLVPIFRFWRLDAGLKIGLNTLA
jgi:hypothetical protein